MAAMPSAKWLQTPRHWFHLWVVICLAWMVLAWLLATNHTQFIDHDYLLRSSRLPWGLALLLFLASWQLMIIAMMLPSSLSICASLAFDGSPIRHIWRRQAVFLLGYALTWTGFALAAFCGDTLIHWLVNHWLWLSLHDWIIGTLVLLIAGIFQVAPLWQRTIRQCTLSLSRIAGSEAHSAIGDTTFRLGLRYGRLCVGSCWTIMLVMVALGMKSLLLMALLTGVMVLEKELPDNWRLRGLIGLLFLGSAVLAIPGLLIQL